MSDLQEPTLADGCAASVGDARRQLAAAEGRQRVIANAQHWALA